VRGGGRDPGVRRPGSGLGRPTARSKFPCRNALSVKFQISLELRSNFAAKSEIKVERSCDPS